jgi:hypothetical protein
VIEKVDLSTDVFNESVLQLQQLLQTERLLYKQLALIDKFKTTLAGRVLGKKAVNVLSSI